MLLRRLLKIFLCLREGVPRYLHLCTHSYPTRRSSDLGQFIRRHFPLDLVPGEDADVVLAHAPGYVLDDLVAVLQLHPEHGVREGFGDRAFKFYDVVFRNASWTAA